MIFDPRKVRLVQFLVFGLSAMLFGIKAVQAIDVPNSLNLFGLIVFGFGTLVFGLAVIRELRKVEDNG